MISPLAMPRYDSIDDAIASYNDRFQPEKAVGVNDSVHMSLSGAEPREIVLRVNDGTLDIQQGTVPEDATLTLHAKSEDWLAIENGDLNPMMAMMQGKAKLRGSMPFAMKFMGMFGFTG